MTEKTSHRWRLKHSKGARASFYEYTAPQMSPGWMEARRYRFTGNSWLSALAPDKLQGIIQRVLGDGVIVPTGSLHGITSEPRARASYISEANLGSDWRVPGLCIPNPFDPWYNWIPREKRFLLLFTGGSPDLMFGVTSRGEYGIAEFKCPESKEIYPDVLSTNKSRYSHYGQMQANTMFVGASFCDYFIWTENRTFKLRTHCSQKFIRDILPKILLLIEKHVLPHFNENEFLIPEDLKEWFISELANWRAANELNSLTLKETHKDA